MANAGPDEAALRACVAACAPAWPFTIHKARQFFYVSFEATDEGATAAAITVKAQLDGHEQGLLGGRKPKLDFSSPEVVSGKPKSTSADEIECTSVSEAVRIQGLELLSEVLTEEEERQMLAEIDARSWLTHIKRRVQHYGYGLTLFTHSAHYPYECLEDDLWCGQLRIQLSDA